MLDEPMKTTASRGGKLRASCLSKKRISALHGAGSMEFSVMEYSERVQSGAL
jgi:hypothetical protein